MSIAAIPRRMLSSGCLSLLFTSIVCVSACGDASRLKEAVNTEGQPPEPGYTSEQADRGRILYRQGCVECHGTTLANGPLGAPLKGSYFRDRWQSRPMAALYAVTRGTMPPENPNSLSARETGDLLALILRENGLAPGQVELPYDIEQLGKMILFR